MPLKQRLAIAYDYCTDNKKQADFIDFIEDYFEDFYINNCVDFIADALSLHSWRERRERMRFFAPDMPLEQAATEGKKTSSNIGWIGYNNRKLRVGFIPKPTKNRPNPVPSVYEYDVDPEFYEAMAAAESKGKFLWNYLRGKTPGRVIDAPEKMTPGGVGGSLVPYNKLAPRRISSKEIKRLRKKFAKHIERGTSLKEIETRKAIKLMGMPAQLGSPGKTAFLERMGKIRTKLKAKFGVDFMNTCDFNEKGKCIDERNKYYKKECPYENIGKCPTSDFEPCTGRWITIKGVHICIQPRETKLEAIKRFASEEVERELAEAKIQKRKARITAESRLMPKEAKERFWREVQEEIDKRRRKSRKKKRFFDILIPGENYMTNLPGPNEKYFVVWKDLPGSKVAAIFDKYEFDMTYDTFDDLVEWVMEKIGVEDEDEAKRIAWAIINSKRRQRREREAREREERERTQRIRQEQRERVRRARQERLQERERRRQESNTVVRELRDAYERFEHELQQNRLDNAQIIIDYFQDQIRILDRNRDSRYYDMKNKLDSMEQRLTEREEIAERRRREHEQRVAEVRLLRYERRLPRLLEGKDIESAEELLQKAIQYVYSLDRDKQPQWERKINQWTNAIEESKRETAEEAERRRTEQERREAERAREHVYMGSEPGVAEPELPRGVQLIRRGYWATRDGIRYWVRPRVRDPPPRQRRRRSERIKWKVKFEYRTKKYNERLGTYRWKTIKDPNKFDLTKFREGEAFHFYVYHPETGEKVGYADFVYYHHNREGVVGAYLEYLVINHQWRFKGAATAIAMQAVPFLDKHNILVRGVATPIHRIMPREIERRGNAAQQQWHRENYEKLRDMYRKWGGEIEQVEHRGQQAVRMLRIPHPERVRGPLAFTSDTKKSEWIDIKLDLDNVFEVGGYVFYFDEEKKQFYQLKTKFKEIK